jgi:hypothetical protein
MKAKIYFWIIVFFLVILSVWIFTIILHKDSNEWNLPSIFIENYTKRQYYIDAVPIKKVDFFPFENFHILSEFDMEYWKFYKIDVSFLDKLENGEYLELLLGKNHYYMQFQDVVIKDWELSFKLRSKYFNWEWRYFYDIVEEVWFCHIKVSSTDWVNASFELKFDTLWNAFFLDTDIEKPQEHNINF